MSKSRIEREIETIKMANGFARIRILSDDELNVIQNIPRQSFHAEDEMMYFDEPNQHEKT